MSSPARTTRRARLVLLLVLVLSACTPATPDTDTYRERTKLAVTDTISHVVTARKVLASARDDKIMDNYALSTVRASEDTLSKVAGSYSELYPPPKLDPVFDRASGLLGDAEDLLTGSRIALHRDAVDRYPALIDELDKLTKQLERLERRLG